MLKIIKIILPVVFLSTSLTAFAAINAPKYEGTCNPGKVELSGNGTGEIQVDSLRVNDANGNWTVTIPLKTGSHTVSVGSESLTFNIPKCPDGGGVLNQTPCLGLFGKFWDNCQAAVKKVLGPTESEKVLIAELRNQILILELRIQILKLELQLKQLLRR